MSHQSKFAAMLCAAVACSLLTIPKASAASLPCVERVIAWNNAHRNNYTSFTAVALHSSRAAAYTTGTLANSTCTRAPYADGTVSCIVSRDPFNSVWTNALLSNRTFYTPKLEQPFDVSKPLPLAIDTIPVDTLAQVHMRQPNATYDFDARCVGDLLVGDDQWGNHWAVAFELLFTRTPA